ncbi:MAG: hypothetical protein QOH46_4002 [Solirubrobacteraceae bacterium]|nr:hypothetical protein [Solirubrobacteraceae bacterium]
MALRRSTSAAFSCVACAFLLALSGCGENPRENDASREGLPEEVGKIHYNVYITRELNLRDVEDIGYYSGPEAPPGFALYGVFLTACNEEEDADSPLVPPATDFTVVDTQGNRFEPEPLPRSNIFAYTTQVRPLKHLACIPKEGSLASTGPTNGSLLIFKLPLDTLENRPLDLEIVSPPDAETGERETGRIELDV